MTVEIIDAIESVALIPNSTQNFDELWVIVNRANGRFIERMSLRPVSVSCEDEEKVLLSDQIFLDSALSYDSPLDILGVTLSQAATTFNVASHGLLDDDLVLVKCIEGTSELNGNTYKVTNALTDYFEIVDPDTDLSINSASFTEYISGGYVYEKANSFSGLDHLDGETVGILADGEVLDQVEVSGGSVNLASSYGIVHVGIPYNCDFQTNNIDFNQ